MAETDNQMIMRIVLVLGAVFLFVSLMVPAQIYVTTPLQDTAFGDFSSSIQTFPTFVNPFDRGEAPISTYAFVPATLVNGPTVEGDRTINTTGCSSDPDEHYECIRDFNGTDGSSSYLTLKSSGSNAVFDLEGSGLPGQIFRSGFVDVWCRASGATSIAPTDLFSPIIQQWRTDIGPGYFAITVDSDQTGCPTGSVFKQITIPITPGYVVYPSGGSPFRLTMTLGYRNPGATQSIDVSTVRVRANYQPSDTPGCAGADFFSNIGCQLGQIFDTFVKALEFASSGLLFIGQILFWFIVTMASFLGLILELFSLTSTWPPVIQGIFLILVVAMIAFLGLVVFGKIRGTGNVG